MDKEILISFLNSVLSSDIKDVDIKEEKLQRDKIDDKLGILDIKATLDTGEKINIEVQQLNQYNMIKRTLFYWSKLYTENFKARDDYKQLTKAITINILGFDLLDSESYHSSYHVYEDTTFKRLNDDLEIHFIELPKFKKIKKDLHNPLHRWLLFLQEDVEPKVLEEIISMDSVIKRAEEKLTYLSSDEEFRRLYELREKQLRDEISRINGAREEGKLEGKLEGKKEVAKKLLKLKTPIEVIAESTGFSKEEIMEIAKEEGN
jgi:predicted transposase/invertase (TIGR01784 family)